MKKILFLLVGVALLSSCGEMQRNKNLKAENDSLNVALAERDAELEGIMEAFNEVQEGFRLINEAENRVDLQSGSVEGASAAQKIREDIRFITEKLQSNRDRIAELEKQLDNSKYASAQLKEELAAKTQQIETLQTELASKNIRIAELDDAVAGLSQHVSDLVAENKAKDAMVASQDKALNTAWFVFGTSSELKDQKIITKKFLQKTKVLEDDDFNKNYFTQIDIRTDKEIKLYSKEAKLLTAHPEGTYELKKDDKGQLTLVITNPNKFWSVSRYLVIEVK